MLPAGFEISETRLRSSEDFIDQYQYTRGDAKKRNDAKDIINEEISADGSNLMIYSGQSILPGAVFYHGFILQNISPLEIGALLNALNEWDALGGTIGGSARIGHGKLRTSFWLESGEDFYGTEMDTVELVKQYRQHVADNKDKITDWLMFTFPKKERKAKAEKKSTAELADDAAQGELT
jgi:hypothetical protein